MRVNGKRCRLTHPVGQLYCRWHEESVARRARNWTLAQDAPDMSVEQHLTLELKMSIIQVRELEFQVLDLGLSVEAFRIGTEEREDRDSPEPKSSYVSVRTAQLHGAHPVILQYLREREHHMKVIQLCVSAGIAAKQLAVVEKYVDSLVAAQVSLVEALGHDANDPMVREAMMDAIRKQQTELSDTTFMRQLGA